MSVACPWTSTSCVALAASSVRWRIEQADAFREQVEHYTDAVARRPAETTPLMTLGLVGTAPEADLATAREAFARGDLAASAEAADQAAASWLNAEPSGQRRGFSIAAIIVALSFIVALLVVGVRRRRRRWYQARRIET